MGMTIVFIGLAAVLGTACYLVLRRLLWEGLTQWRQQKQAAQEAQRRGERAQALRREAMDAVLAQIGRQDDGRRETA